MDWLFGRFLLLAFGAPSLLGACQAAPGARVPPPYDVYVAPGMQSSVVADVRDSVAAWNAAVGVEVLVYRGEGAPAEEDCGTVVVDWDEAIHAKHAQGMAYLGDDCHWRIGLSTAGFWHTTVRHELGHVLGLPDGHRFTDAEIETQDETASIMDNRTLWREITSADVEAVRRLHGI